MTGRCTENKVPIIATVLSKMLGMPLKVETKHLRGSDEQAAHERTDQQGTL
jgi:hypothetical protein